MSLSEAASPSSAVPSCTSQEKLGWAVRVTLKGHGFKQQRFISCSLSMALVGLHYHVGGCRLNSTASRTQTDEAHCPGPHVIQALALLGPRKKESLYTGSEKLLLAFHWPKQSRGLATFQSYAAWKEDWKYLCMAHTPSDVQPTACIPFFHFYSSMGMDIPHLAKLFFSQFCKRED